MRDMKSKKGEIPYPNSVRFKRFVLDKGPAIKELITLGSFAKRLLYFFSIIIFFSFLGSYSTSTTVGSHYGSPLGSIPSSHSFQPPSRHIDNIPPPLSALGPPHHPHHLPPGIENYKKKNKRLPLGKIASLVDFNKKRNYKTQKG